jgi:hypothetical protein
LRVEHNFGGLLRPERNLIDDTMLFAAVLRSVRTADVIERTIARRNWVGNLNIDP